MDSIRSPFKRKALVDVDANRRNMNNNDDTKPEIMSILSHSVDEKILIRKRKADGEEENVKEGLVSHKKRKIEDKQEKVGNKVPLIEIFGSESEERIDVRIKEEFIEEASATTSTTRNSSPISSFQSSQMPNHSQETNISSPDHNDTSAARQTIVKQQADALRLRLRIAMYKVHTDQVSVPLSRLEVRSISHFSKNNNAQTRNRAAAASPPSLGENKHGEALLIPAARISSLHHHPSFQEPPIMSSQLPNLEYSSPYELPQAPVAEKFAMMPGFYERPVAYSTQKRRASVGSSCGSSDIELEIPIEVESVKPDWKRELELARRAEMHRRRQISVSAAGSFVVGGGYRDDVFRRRRVDDGDEEINVIRARRDGRFGRSADEVEGAADGLLNLWEEG